LIDGSGRHWTDTVGYDKTDRVIFLNMPVGCFEIGIVVVSAKDKEKKKKLGLCKNFVKKLAVRGIATGGYIGTCTPQNHATACRSFIGLDIFTTSFANCKL